MPALQALRVSSGAASSSVSAARSSTALPLLPSASLFFSRGVKVNIADVPKRWLNLFWGPSLAFGGGALVLWEPGTPTDSILSRLSSLGLVLLLIALHSLHRTNTAPPKEAKEIRAALKTLPKVKAPPKRGASAFILFAKDNFARIFAQTGKASATMKVAGKEWKEASESVREVSCFPRCHFFALFLPV